jgi:hypothetical protein
LCTSGQVGVCSWNHAYRDKRFGSCGVSLCIFSFYRFGRNEHKQKNYIQNFESLKDGLHFNLLRAVATVVMDKAFCD